MLSQSPKAKQLRHFYSRRVKRNFVQGYLFAISMAICNSNAIITEPVNWGVNEDVTHRPRPVAESEVLNINTFYPRLAINHRAVNNRPQSTIVAHIYNYNCR